MEPIWFSGFGGLRADVYGMQASQAPIQPVSSLPRRTLAWVLDTAMATAAGGGAVLLGSTQVVEGVEGVELQVLRLLVVSAVVLVGLVVYRWMSEKRVQHALESVRQSAEEELTRAKDHFIANVSHGLRTPLTGIVGFSHLLQESVERSQDREAVAMILGETAELSRITDDLLTAARLDADVLEIEPENVAVVQQVEEVVEFMDLLGAKVVLDLERADVRVDPERFRQVLRNLLVNAHRHGRPQVTVRGRVRHDRYVCHVIDQGSGVPIEVQGTVFERFAYRPTDGVSGYVGLGLSIVQELCRRMDVQVSYRRIRGETHFVTSLPLGTDLAQKTDTGDSPGRRMVRFPAGLIRQGHHPVRVPG